MKRTLLMSIVTLFALTLPARAADRPATDPPWAAAVAPAAADAPQIVTAAVVTVTAPGEVVAKRTGLLLSMYATCGILQAYDGYSTIKAAASNHVELNPMMAPLAQHPALVVAAKAAMTVATIAAAENLWRNHHHGQAIAMMVVSNGLMAAVGAHNAMLLRGR